MVDRFNAVARRGHLNFEAWFNDRIEPDRSWTVNEAEWEFRYRYVRRWSKVGVTTRVAPPLERQPLPDLLISLYSEPIFLLGWAAARRRRIRTAFWTEVTFDRWIQRTATKEMIKRYLFARVDSVLTCGEQGRTWVARYGIERERMQHIVQGIDIEHFVAGSRLTGPDRTALRDELGLKGVTFLYVGRFFQGKGLDTLIDAFARVQRACLSEVSLLLVGDGRDEARLRSRVAQMDARNVVFAGFQQKGELPGFHAVAHVFVFPTRGDPYGLAVNEAMASGLPIISTTEAGEIGDRVRAGVTGDLVPADDPVALANKMSQFASDSDAREAMGQRAAELVGVMTTEAYAASLEAAVERIMQLPARGAA